MYGDLISRVVDFEGRPFRNIKGIRESQDLFDDLGEEDADLLAAIAAEGTGKPEPRDMLIRRPFDYGSVVTYPFFQEPWQATRFSDGTRFGVWYGSQELETTVYETVHHWRQFVLDAFADEDRSIVADRRVFRVFCQGILVDLREKEVEWPALIDPGSYEFTQKLGAYLKEQNQNGALVRSARCSGSNLAVFTPAILSNPEDVCYLTYRFNPLRRGPVTVEREAGVPWLDVP